MVSLIDTVNKFKKFIILKFLLDFKVIMDYIVSLRVSDPCIFDKKVLLDIPL